MLVKVTDFLQDLFCGKPMFEHVHHFKHVFPNLKKLGGEMTGIGQLITMLAEDAANETSNFDMSKVDVVDRPFFRGTPLFRSYCESSFSKMLGKARTALGGSDIAAADWSATGGPAESNIAECKRHLEFALQMRPVNQGLIDTAQCGLKWFCSGTPQRQLLEHFHKNPRTVGKFLNHWAPRAPIYVACRMTTEDGSFLHNKFGDLVNWAVPSTSLITVLITGCQITDCQITHCNTNRCRLELPRLLVLASWTHATLCPQTLSWRAAAF